MRYLTNRNDYAIIERGKVVKISLHKYSTLHDKGNSSMGRKKVTKISPQQKEIFFLVCQGFRGSDISAELGIDRKTVYTHLDRMRKKVDATNDVQAVLRILSGHGQ